MLEPIKVLVLICLYTCLVVVNTQNCGRPKTQSVTNTLIVGGVNALKGEFPWQAIVLRYFKDKQGASYIELCGGVIINEQWILTAAHCIAKSSNPSKYEVKLGYLDQLHLSGNESTHKVDTLIFHENYDPNQKGPHNDIGLVKIVDKLNFNGKDSNLEPICLATNGISLKDNCIATGFGYLHAEGKAATILQKVNEPIYDISSCQRLFTRVDSRTNVCAGGTGRTGTCMGDSGGPLQCEGSDGLWYEVGITSYGVPCGTGQYPDVFTRVDAFEKWIKDNIAIYFTRYVHFRCGNSEICGKSGVNDVDTDWSVEGGVDTVVGEYPWHALISPGQGKPFCAGALINDNWVLTAGHCVVFIEDVKGYVIRLGAHNHKVKESTESQIKIKKIVINKEYDIGMITNDIALIQLKEKLDFNGKHKHLAPICLNNTNTEVTDNCLVIGFGLSDSNKDRPQVLQKSSQPILDTNICAKVYDP
ncbi:unnamed protein product, partial [Oppiella nova]